MCCVDYVFLASCHVIHRPNYPWQAKTKKNIDTAKQSNLKLNDAKCKDELHSTTKILELAIAVR